MKWMEVIVSCYHTHIKEGVSNIGALPGLFSLVVQRNQVSSSLSQKHLN